jgi:hypothetical protein
MLGYFYRLQLQLAMRYFKTRRSAKMITVALFGAVFILVAYGLYQFFYRGFVYLNTYSYFRGAVTLYSLEVLFLIVIFLAWVSAVIGILFGIFKNPKYSLIATSPKFQLIPHYSFISSMFSSSWIFMFLVLPVVLAGARAFHFGLSGIILGFVSGLGLLTLAVAGAFISVFGTAWLLNAMRKGLLTFRLVAWLQAGFIALGFLALAGGFLRLDLVRMLHADNLQFTEAPIAPLSEAFGVFPSHLTAAAIFNLRAGHFELALQDTAWLFAILFICLAAAALLFRAFLPVFQKLSEGGRPVLAEKMGRRPGNMRLFPLFVSPSGAVFYKEMVSTFRNLRSAYWMLFLILLWTSYVGLTAVLQRNLERHQVDLPVFTNAMLALQLVVLAYFVSALVLRFAFPSFSTEKNTAWIVASSPLSLSRLFWIKTVFYAIIFSMFAAGAQFFNTTALHLSPASGGIYLLLSLASAVFVSALGSALGAKYPNFETDNPQQLSTSLPGLAFVFGSILYGGLSALVYYAFLKGGGTLLPVFFILLSAAGSFYLAINAARSVRHLEFINLRN